MICTNCNNRLGSVRDSIETLRYKIEQLYGLIEYLEHPPLRGVEITFPPPPVISRRGLPDFGLSFIEKLRKEHEGE